MKRLTLSAVTVLCILFAASILYRASKLAKAKVEGEVVSITFVPKDFKLKP